MKKNRDIIPPKAASLRTLTATMAVMCYLACLAVGALVLIDRAVDAWASGLSQEVTVQVLERSDGDLAADLNKAIALLQEAEGVVSVEDMGEEAGKALLEPWLGSEGLDALPIPRLLRVKVDEQSPPDFEVLAAELQQVLPNASLDTHRRWEAELARMAGSLSLLSALVLALIVLSAVAMVISASRAVLEGNRPIVDVLKLVGAEDRFISRQMDWRFLATGLWGGFLGLGLALITFFALGYAGWAASPGLAAASRGLFYIPTADSWIPYVALLAVPLAATVIALVTSRMALTQMLQR